MSIRNVLVVAVIAVGLALLARFTIYLYREELREWQLVEVVFEDVGGLRVKDAVLVQGSRMGRVGEIRLLGDKQLVILQVEPSVEVYAAGAGAKIVSANSLGFVNVVLERGQPLSGPLPPGQRLSGTLYMGVGQSAPGPDRRKSLRAGIADFAAMTSAIQDPRSGSTGRLLFDPHRKIALRQGIRDLRASWADNERQLLSIENGDGLGRGLDPDGLSAVANTIGALRRTLTGVGDSLTRAARGEGNAGVIVADPVQGRATREALEGWTRAIDGVEQGRGMVGRLTDPTSDATEALESTIDALAQGTTEMRAGRGLLGALASPGVDEQVRDLARRVPRGLEELSRDPVVRDRGAYFQLHDGMGSFDDAVVNLRRGLQGLRRDLAARSTFQGAVFAIF